MSTYKGQTPSTIEVDPRVVSFFENFYAVSDNPTAHDEYVSSLTPDADFIMGTKKARGSDDILAIRKALWLGPVQSRKHKLEKIFPFGKDSHEVMVYGSVDYGLKNGREVTVDWAGRAKFVEHQGALKMSFYQVYLDSAPVANAAKE